jgi:biopolymer transport protein TolR
MSQLTGIQRRAEHRDRNKQQLDMNLVSLIDIFTILIFFLLSNSSEVELLPSSRAVKLPESTSQRKPRETVVVTVTADEILVQGHRVAMVADWLNTEGDLIEPLKAQLDDEASRQTIRKENEAQSRAVTIMGDRQIPYRLLRKVMVTCARANFSEVAFAVRRKDETT